MTSIQYFNNNELSANVWDTKYALRKQNEQIESNPDEMHTRMAKEFVRIENNYAGKRLNNNLIYDLFRKFRKVIPQGSVMALLGNPYQVGSLSNCIVLPEIYDSYGGIMYTDQQLAQVMKRRCGGGIDISTLRPEGTIVTNAAQTSTGAVSFMPRFSCTTREVAQGGRRGALMITMNIIHPNSDKFALIKQDLNQINGANISLKITDEFMECVENNDDFIHRYPIDINIPINSNIWDWPYNKIVLGTDKTCFKKARAKDLWNTIISCAHNTAEPGLIFWDRQHWYSTSSVYPDFKNISTNPCSEIAMNNDSCRLITKNMFNCVRKPFTEKAYFDFEEWYWLSYNTMRLADDLVDLEIEHIDKILDKIEQDDQPPYIKEVEKRTWEDLKESGIEGRRTGCGFTALADTLAALGYAYDSPEAIEFIDKVCRTMLAGDLDSSIDMAEERGAFPSYDAGLEAHYADQEGTFFYMLKNEFPLQWERMQKIGRRNISWSTVAPNGSTSLLCNLDKGYFGTSSGIEPLFKLFYYRKKKINPNDKGAIVDYVDDLGDKWQEFPVFHEGFKMWYEVNYSNTDFKLEDFTEDQLEELVKKSPYYKSTAEEIDWIKRVEIQGIIQKYITHSISSTINLPNDATEQDVSDIYFEAWKKGLKGITVYRDGCREGVLVTESKKNKCPECGEGNIIHEEGCERCDSCEWGKCSI